MIEFIQGKLVDGSISKAIINVNGIGYKLIVPTNMLMPPIGSDILLYTSLIVREPYQHLYGFSSVQERDLFEILINIPGIGPKTGISLISCLSYDTLLDAVMQNNIHTITKVPGIGKKTAERFIIEIKDKLPGIFSNAYKAIKSSQIPQEVIKDAMSALINLGYNQSAAEKAIIKTTSHDSSNMDLPTLISKSLKYINN